MVAGRALAQTVGELTVTVGVGLTVTVAALESTVPPQPETTT